MNPTPPVELKPYQIYLARASETRLKEPLVSYFCRLFVAEQLMMLPRNPPKDQYMLFLLDELDRDKASLSHDAKAILANEQMSYQCLLKFSLRVFLVADNEDREGKASIKTGKTFLAAATFFEVLKLFTKELDLEIEEKIRYAKWKAADIIKAVKAGTKPMSGPPDYQLHSAEESDSSPHADQGHAFLEPVSLNEDVGPASSTSAHSLPMDTDRMAKIEEAQKQAKFAISALQYEDIQTAKSNLLRALSLLDSL